MGCDIHFYVEKLDNGKWVRAEAMETNPYKQMYWDHCVHCDNLMVEVDNPYKLLGADEGMSDEQVANLWQAMVSDIAARQLEGTVDEAMAMSLLSAIHLAYDSIKTQELRTLVPATTSPHPVEGLYHIEDNGGSQECGRLDEVATRQPELTRSSYYKGGRNYELFALLSSVRGLPPEEGQLGIDGLPEDVSDELRKEFEAWGMDAHSEGYATLQDLMAHPWWGKNQTHRVKVWTKEVVANDNSARSQEQMKQTVNWHTSYCDTYPELHSNLERLRDQPGVEYIEITISDAEWGDSEEQGIWLYNASRPAREPDVVRDLEITYADSKFQGFVRTLSRMTSHVTDGDLSTVRGVWWFDN
jgi:hypothetical protein